MIIHGENVNIIAESAVTPGTYYREYLEDVRDQPTAVSLKEITVEFPINSFNYTPAVIGLDNTGGLLTGNESLITLPCPPYCMRVQSSVPIFLNQF